LNRSVGNQELFGFSRALAYVELAKVRMTIMVAAVAAVGFYIAHSHPLAIGCLPPLIAAVVGTALVTIGAGAVNQVLERRLDARMYRTAIRPIPTGRLSVDQALRFAVMTTLAGLAVLAFSATPVSAVVAMVSWVTYTLVYTPLKKLTPLSVVVGAVPGALPVVIGWTAATGTLDAKAFLPFFIIFMWQIPHFQAIAWLYRDDYARAGYPVLPVIEPSGRRAIIQMILFCVILIPISLLPTVFGLVGQYYYVGALVMGCVLLAFGFEVARLRTRASARQMLMASLAYLPLLFILMTIDKNPM